MSDIGFVSPQSLHFAEPLALRSGQQLADYTIVYETYGTLNADRSNAVLVCHALTGDQYVADTHPVTGKEGWWSQVVGPGRPVDTGRFFVICANVLGGCMGSTGPRSDHAGEPWGKGFPPITIRDMVRAQRLLVDRLGRLRQWFGHWLLGPGGTTTAAAGGGQ